MLTLDLPLMPSTNRLYRMARDANGRRRKVWTTAYASWMRVAGNETNVQLVGKPRACLAEPFGLVLLLGGKVDIDNIKAVPDFLKHMNLIDDDESMKVLLTRDVPSLGRRCRATFGPLAEFDALLAISVGFDQPTAAREFALT